jgi:cytoplasmic iron level regulating protein YaaA (DUF328/UPF0246 family)
MLTPMGVGCAVTMLQVTGFQPLQKPPTKSTNERTKHSNRRPMHRNELTKHNNRRLTHSNKLTKHNNKQLMHSNRRLKNKNGPTRNNNEQTKRNSNQSAWLLNYGRLVSNQMLFVA